MNHAGFHNGLRQPDQRLTIRLDRCPAAIDWEAFDAWLSEKLAIALQADTEGAALDSQALRLMWRIMQVAAGLLRAARIPVFEPGRVLSCRPDTDKPGAWLGVIAVPHVDFISAESTHLAYNWAISLVLEMALASERPSRPEGLYLQLEERVLQPLRAALPAGKSSIHLLRTARDCDIPWRHLGNGVFQLGWGRHALRIRRSKVESDSLIGAETAQHKFVAAQWMRQAGLPVPDHYLVWDEAGAQQAAQNLGGQLVVKPVDCDRGEGVTVDVDALAALRDAFRYAAQFSKQVLVERLIPGVCHRLLVVRGQVLYTVQRQPVAVQGDGRMTVAQCIQAANERRQDMPVWNRPPPYPMDDLAEAELGRAGLTMDSVLGKGHWASLRPIESTQWGGRDVDYSTTLHADNADIAIRAAALFGLDIAGIDIISRDITRPWHENGAAINEVNVAPLLGASPSSLDTLHALMGRLMGGDGRIPIGVVVGARNAAIRARILQQQWIAKGHACHVTSHEETVAPSGSLMPIAVRGLFARSMALLMNKDVGALILVAHTDELLYTGLPVDRFDLAEWVADELVAVVQSGETARERTQQLARLLGCERNR
jgi:cyanophycin synthetase